MADNLTANNQLKNILGMDRGTAPANVTTGLGLILWGTGLFLSNEASAKVPRYGEDTLPDVEAMGKAFDAEMEATGAKLDSDIGTYGTNVQGGIARDLVNRGLSDPGVSKASQAQYGQSLSGAYALAHKTLALAKSKASSVVENARINYLESVSKGQMDNLVKEQARKAGLWSALGGGAVAGIKEMTSKIKPIDAPATPLDALPDELTPKPVEGGYIPTMPGFPAKRWQDIKE